MLDLLPFRLSAWPKDVVESIDFGDTGWHSLCNLHSVPYMTFHIYTTDITMNSNYIQVFLVNMTLDKSVLKNQVLVRFDVS